MAGPIGFDDLVPGQDAATPAAASPAAAASNAPAPTSKLDFSDLVQSAPQDTMTPAAPYDAMDAAVHGMTLGLSDAGRAAMLAYSRYLFGQSPTYDYEGAAREIKAGREAYEKGSPWTSLGANVAGSLVGPGGAATTMMKDAGAVGQVVKGALTGSAMGGVQGAADNATSMQDAVQAGKQGAAWGAALGGAIPAAFGTASAMFPALTPEAQTLRAAGIQPTPGSATGGVPAVAENLVSKIPVIGAPIQAARGAAKNQFADAVAKNTEDFNRRTVNYALAPIGESLGDDTEVGNDAFSELRDKVQKAYQAAVPGAGGTLDAQANGAITNAVANARLGLPQAQADQFANFINTNVIDRVKNGVLAGQDFKDADTMLGKEASDYIYGPGSNPDQRKLGLAYQQLQGNLRDWLARVSPQNAAGIQAANQAWARALRVQEAASRGDPTSGVFTPKNLMQAVKNQSTQSQFAQGTAPMQDVARNAMLNEQAFQLAGKSLPTPTGGTLHGGGGVGPSVFAANMLERSLENPTLTKLALAGTTWPALAALYSNTGRRALLGTRQALSNLPPLGATSPLASQFAAPGWSPIQISNGSR